MNAAARKYMRRLKREIGKTDPQKKAFLDEIRADVDEYAREDTDYTALCEHFGEPSAVAGQFDAPDETVRNRKMAKINPWLVALVVLLAILLLILAVHFCELIISAYGTHVVIKSGYDT